ncbi:facilitated trehalose transporter Tret1 isoform X2 [Bemisia tabaci]|uniref:facilitated trehalose transporter Tret1 isoform X2 n=1 Tax=Bemisia tabaci TaxID=7038 RepID=UPI003B286754
MSINTSRIIQVAATVAAHLNSISVGMCQGYSAVLLPQLTSHASPLQVSNDEASWIASLGVISNPVGALLSGVCMEIFGRRTAVQLTSLPFLIGWTIIALSQTLTTLCIGRFISGMAIGMASACYVYVAEISQPEHRGILSSTGPVFVSLGVLIVYSLGSLCSWQFVSAVCAAAAMLSFSAMQLVPESPYWLASKGMTKESHAALSWLRSSAHVEKDISELVNNSRDISPRVSTLKLISDRFNDPCVWKPFFILVGFFLFQEGSGIYIILYYAVDFFRRAGSTVDHNVASIIVASLRFAMSIFGSLCIQNFGRRTLAVTSGILMALSIGAAGVYEHFFEDFAPADRPYPWVPLACILTNVCASMLGLLQLPWLMIGELFPLKVRGIMGGVVSSLAYLFIFATVKIYPNLMANLQMSGSMFGFAIASLMVVVYALMFLPETRGKTLLEIEQRFCDIPKTNSTENLEKGFYINPAISVSTVCAIVENIKK